MAEPVIKEGEKKSLNEPKDTKLKGKGRFVFILPEFNDVCNRRNKKRIKFLFSSKKEKKKGASRTVEISNWKTSNEEESISGDVHSWFESLRMTDDRKRPTEKRKNRSKKSKRRRRRRRGANRLRPDIGKREKFKCQPLSAFRNQENRLKVRVEKLQVDLLRDIFLVFKTKLRSERRNDPSRLTLNFLTFQRSFVFNGLS
jgi:hypothetical protein